MGKTRIWGFSKTTVKSSWKFVDVLSHAHGCFLKVSYNFPRFKDSCRSLKSHAQRLYSTLSYSKIFWVVLHITDYIRQSWGPSCCVRLGYCFTSYQRLWLYNGAPLVAFYDTQGIRRTYSRLKPPASPRGSKLLFEPICYHKLKYPNSYTCILSNIFLFIWSNTVRTPGV